jgi:hypothetical protein
MKQDAPSWSLAANVGQLRCGALSAEVDLTRPHLGLRAAKLRDKQLSGEHLSLVPSDVPSTQPSCWPATLADAYIRGRDLVATYAGVETWPYSPTVYWSADTEKLGQNSGEILAALSLVVSIQTNLLDTHPRIDIRTSLSADEIVLVSVAGDELLVDSHVDGPQSINPRTNACGLIWRVRDCDLSYAEIMPTSDFHQLAVTPTGEHPAQSRWELFSEFLEKGVIRRARLQSLFLPRENDVQLVAECCQAVERKPLPLTT